MKVLVTGNAGFIGFHTARHLLERGDTVIGFDSVSDYYDTGLKEDRLRALEVCAATSAGRYHFIRANLADAPAVRAVFSDHRPDRVIHLAAQAGVRHSLNNPEDYVEANLAGFMSILEACRHHGTQHLTYASTSSVYGANRTVPFSEDQTTAHPVSFYAATKRANELMAHAYSHLFALPTTGLRFFSVYGPWGRPDMAPFIFTKHIIEGRPIQVFNEGRHSRDFTYIDDIVGGVIRASDQIAEPDPDWDSKAPDPGTSNAPFRVYNIGNNAPVTLMALIETIEDCVGRKAEKEFLPQQPGDIEDGLADCSRLADAVGYEHRTSIKAGIQKFVDWYRAYYRIPSAPAQSAP